MESSSCPSSAALARVQAGRRLVEAEQHRIGAHGARDFEPALVAIGQVAGGIVGAVDQTDGVEPAHGFLDRSLSCAPRERVPSRECRTREKPDARISGLCCATSRFSSTVMPRNSRIFWKVRATRACCATRWSGMRSSRNSEPPAAHLAAHRAGGQRVDPLPRRRIAALQGDAAFGRLVEAGDAIEHGGLAGAVRADQGGDLAVPRDETTDRGPPPAHRSAW